MDDTEDTKDNVVDLSSKDPTKFKKRFGEKNKLKSDSGRRPRKGVDDRIILTDRQEMYAKLRAEGYSKTAAGKSAFSDANNPAQSGYACEKLEHVKKRIEQLREERAWAAKLVDPQESLARWNGIYMNAMERGDIKTAIEAQKQIDKINGAEAAVVRQQLEIKGMFRGEDESEWKRNIPQLLSLLNSMKDKS